jgi:hypothetical protein
MQVRGLFRSRRSDIGAFQRGVLLSRFSGHLTSCLLSRGPCMLLMPIIAKKYFDRSLGKLCNYGLSPVGPFLNFFFFRVDQHSIYVMKYLDITTHVFQ